RRRPDPRAAPAPRTTGSRPGSARAAARGWPRSSPDRLEVRIPLRRGRRACQLGQEAQGEPTGVDVGLETRSGARRAAAVAPAIADERGRGGDELLVAFPEADAQPDPAGCRLVQVDRRRLVVWRADLGHEP